MSIEALVKMFETYGWSGMIAVVIILLVYYFISKKDKKTVDTINAGFVGLSTAISQQNNTLINTITTSNENTQKQLFDLVTKAIDNKAASDAQKHKESLARRSEISEMINDILVDLLQETHAQRTFIIEFHNSQCNLDGLAFLWYDMQYERQQRGITPISTQMKSMQLVNIHPIIKRINMTENHIVKLTSDDIENIYNESSVLYSQFKKTGTNTIIYSGIYNNNNELIGFIGIEYLTGYDYNDKFINSYTLKEKTTILESLYNYTK
jgi:hypothetical protein